MKKFTGKTRYRTDTRGRFILQAESKLMGSYGCEIPGSSWVDVDATIYTMLGLRVPVVNKHE